MNDHRKTKKQLIAELVQLRKRVTQLEDADTERKQLEEGRVLAGRVLTSSPALICVVGMDGWLEGNVIPAKTGLIEKDAWISLLHSTGLDKEGMKMWHEQFEKISPQAHNDFLVYLGMDEKSIKRIRQGIVQ